MADTDILRGILDRTTPFLYFGLTDARQYHMFVCRIVRMSNALLRHPYLIRPCAEGCIFSGAIWDRTYLAVVVLLHLFSNLWQTYIHEHQDRIVLVE